MANIYTDAWLVISASHSGSDSYGFLRGFEERTWYKHIESKENSDWFDTYVQMDIPGCCALERGHTPTEERAWCLQERLLARRLLSYETGGFHYTCSTSDLYDVSRSVSPHMVEAMLPRLGRLVREEQWLELDDWQQVIQDFLARHLTMYSDRLPARSGVAERVNCKQGSRYLGGLWEDHLPWNLLWHSNNGRTVSPAWHESPSFSWYPAGWIYLIYEKELETYMHCLIEVGEACCYTTGPNPYGHVSWGFLRLVGSLCTAELSRTDTLGQKWQLSSITHRPSGDVAPCAWRLDAYKKVVYPDTWLVTRYRASDDCGLPYLSRSRNRDDRGTSAVNATATLLIFGKTKWPSRQNDTSNDDLMYGGVEFLMLAPTGRPAGCTFE